MMKYKFIIVSKDNNTLLTQSDFENLENVDYERILNNQMPITKLYNIKLAEVRSEKKYNYLIFIHGDAKVNIQSLISHIESTIDKQYDVIGLCGTEIVNVSSSPLNWYTASTPTPHARWGCVTHGEMNNSTSFFNADRSSITDHEVGCIDGVCIIFSDRALNSDLQFDEQFYFDQYDTDLSLQCVLKYKFKLGVLVEKSLQHYSVGKSITTVEFLLNELNLRRKWNFDVPANSKLAALLENVRHKVN